MHQYGKSFAFNCDVRNMQALYGLRVNAISSNVYSFKVPLCKGGESGLKLMTFG